MPGTNGRHLTKENREVIECGLRGGESARRIARKIGASPSTVTREVKANRTVREPRLPKGALRSSRCSHFAACQRGGEACEGCPTRLTSCKRRRTRDCTRSCPDFDLRMCPATQRWPYVCRDGCPKRAHCGYPKCSYGAADADAAYRARLSSSREGIGIGADELAAMDALVAPLVRKGHSFEATWASHAGELPVGVRTAYNYQERGLLSTANIDLPRKVRIRPRKRKGAGGRERVDRSGRTHADFLALPIEDRARAVQLDSVEGLERNSKDILSMHLVAVSFQFYLLKDHASASAVVGWLDAIERTLGSPGEFRALFGVLLADRGVEFDDFDGVERSCLVPGDRRCRLFYCDAMATNQKSQAERNHEQLRRILPKGRSDFDSLSVFDVAACCSHVNSYPLARRGGRCPFELAAGIVPEGLLAGLGLERVPSDEVVLKPSLVPHAVAV